MGLECFGLFIIEENSKYLAFGVKMELNILGIVDTAVKIGLGALISGISTYWITRLQHKNDITKTKLKRRGELIEEVSTLTEEFSSATLTYWAYMIEYVRCKAQDKTVPEDWSIRIKRSEIELFDSFSKLASAEGKLILFGTAKSQELLREYGDYVKEFRRFAWSGNKSLKEEDMNAYRVGIISKRKGLYEEIRAMYA
ncbi:hypothetical protein [Pseudomonas sp. S32]|uniref:hypothetical protein n=1 Tax=Pseudomonas sp. S32 TaxID=2767448 RepID=UPI001913E90F|nr:hypothetical protein [Pseudomonas sp. S32]